jgi:hypothetical protein
MSNNNRVGHKIAGSLKKEMLANKWPAEFETAARRSWLECFKTNGIAGMFRLDAARGPYDEYLYDTMMKVGYEKQQHTRQREEKEQHA